MTLSLPSFISLSIRSASSEDPQEASTRDDSHEHPQSSSPRPSDNTSPSSPSSPQPPDQQPTIPKSETKNPDAIHLLLQNPVLCDPIRTPRFPIVLCHGTSFPHSVSERPTYICMNLQVCMVLMSKDRRRSPVSACTIGPMFSAHFKRKLAWMSSLLQFQGAFHFSRVLNVHGPSSVFFID
jgi:hypothetical protein